MVWGWSNSIWFGGGPIAYGLGVVVLDIPARYGGCVTPASYLQGCIIGSDRFFLGSSGVDCRARSDLVHGYHFPRKLAGGPLQATCLPHLHVAGLPLDSLLSFYEVACCLSTCLSTC